MMNILLNNQKTAIFLVLCRENSLSGSLKDDIDKARDEENERQRQAVVDSNQQSMSAMESRADTHVRGNERSIDKIERPWEVYNDAWGVPQEEVEAAKAERAARLGGIQHTNNSDNNQVGGLSHAVYTAPNESEPKLMYDNGRPVEENTTPLAENQQQEVSGSLNTQSATVANEHKEQHPISDNWLVLGWLIVMKWVKT